MLLRDNCSNDFFLFLPVQWRKGGNSSHMIYTHPMKMYSENVQWKCVHVNLCNYVIHIKRLQNDGNMCAYLISRIYFYWLEFKKWVKNMMDFPQKRKRREKFDEQFDIFSCVLDFLKFRCEKKEIFLMIFDCKVSEMRCKWTLKLLSSLSFHFPYS